MIRFCKFYLLTLKPYRVQLHSTFVNWSSRNQHPELSDHQMLTCSQFHQHELKLLGTEHSVQLPPSYGTSFLMIWEFWKIWTILSVVLKLIFLNLPTTVIFNMCNYVFLYLVFLYLCFLYLHWVSFNILLIRLTIMYFFLVLKFELSVLVFLQMYQFYNMFI